MSRHDDERLRDELARSSIYAQAAGVLMVRLGRPIEDAVRYLFRVADETGLQDDHLAELIVQASNDDRRREAGDAVGTPPCQNAETERILAGADERDARADARDVLADKRDLAASLHSLLRDEHYGPAVEARRSAAVDRAESHDDRSESAQDRNKLAESNPQTGPEGA
jgi:hypothetical protein